MDWAARSVAYIAQQPAPAQPGATGPHLPRWVDQRSPESPLLWPGHEPHVYLSGGARRRMPLDLLRAASLELTPSICLTTGQATVERRPTVLPATRLAHEGWMKCSRCQHE